jgi:hypothetical protein
MSDPGEGERTAVIGAAVEFEDDDGTHWRVTEHDGRAVPGSRGSRYLMFAGPEAIRRVWDFPPGWRDFLPPSLVELSWRR